jgi:hypothetical protein
MGYTANPDSLRKAGTSAKSAGEQAGQLKLDPPAADIAEAMPGAKSQEAAKQVGQSWDKAIKCWSRSAVEHGDSLTESADEYQQSDECGAQNIGQLNASGR